MYKNYRSIAILLEFSKILDNLMYNRLIQFLVDNNVLTEAQNGFLTLTHGAESFLRSCQLCSYSRTSQNFMVPEGSLPYSQEPSTGPYPEADQSNPY
jgi:hypothetical protein